MSELQTTLQKIGLNKKQAAVYIAALELGEASMTELTKKAGLKRPTVYLLVEELELMGLLSSFKKGKRTVHTAQHPNRLLEIMRSRGQQVEEMLPDLLALYNTPKDKPKIQVFEGKRGVEMLYDEIHAALGQKQETLLFTDIKSLTKHFPSALEEYRARLKKIKRPRIRELNYGDAAGIMWAKEMSREMKDNPNHSIRLLPTDHQLGNTDNIIFGSKLAIISYKKDIFVVVIESAEVAQTYRALFEAAWKQGCLPKK
jgi:HTH-type transcriptional regulator, sugar sensing transcriptional regulator